MSWPLTDVQSGYSLLRSLYSIPELVHDLAARGFHAAALTDWETLAGTEEFDRLMREKNLIPYLGVSRQIRVGGAGHAIRLIALSHSAWSALVNFEDWTPVNSPPDLAVVLGPEDNAWWRDLPPIAGPVVVELAAGQQALLELLPPNWYWVPACAVRFPNPEDQMAHRVLAEIGGLTPEREAQALPNLEALMAPYADWPRDRLWSPPEVPSVLPDRGWKMIALGSVEELSEKAEAGLRRRYPDGVPAHARERLSYELRVIGDLGFPGYFLMVADVVGWAKQTGIRVGPGRGSAAGSLVSYALGITEVNPLDYGLVFERFLNPARRTWPDIDLDFEDVRRGEVIAYLRRRFGADRVAQIGTYGTLGARAVLRDVARVMKLPIEAVNQVMRSIDWQLNDRLQDHHDELIRLSEKAHLGTAWIALARRLEGLPRHRSTHAAGVIIAPRSFRGWIHCHGDEQSGWVTDFDMGSLERLGFVKLDVLGLRTLSLLSRIEAEAGLSPHSMATVDGQDPKTLRLLGRGDTDGVFQLDGRGVKRLLREMQPRSREEVMLVVALYRPGPMEMIGELLRRRRDGYRVSSDDPLAALLSETYGVMVYQEQLMAAVQQVAGLSLAEADLIRRAISKKDHALLIQEGQRIIRQMQERGFSRVQADQFWERIRAFGDYGFNKSHAASYGMISYYQAFLKAHYPEAFWAAELSHREGERLGELMRQAMSQGLTIVPPHINHSDEAFRVEGGNLRASLSIIRGLGPETVRRIVEERAQHGPYQNVADIMARLGGTLGQRGLECLALGGALEGLGLVRPRRAQQMSLFESADEAAGEVIERDDRAAWGFDWPKPEGPIYVRLMDPNQSQSVVEAIRRVARTVPGTVPVAVIQGPDRVRRIDDVSVAFDVAAIEALKAIPGVLAAGRQVTNGASSARR
ncbi:DNA polymerase III subunit alpha [Sulfobacillus harzensis]|uniref:DNA-directed DNA polymerase n=1 Tax=Sulfobacillus harzensis TaxID=2729629 RepID=A0A7Y0Q1T9_9FIRM|nr:DNA polymerase III subunit alpha [Sulfobacillus harzensis]NMP21665.1 DNA polymerase III subunit alpha [Sulfobacillus harzensis]